MATSLWKKLNLKEQSPVFVLNAPGSFEPEIAALEATRVEQELKDTVPVTFSLAFVTRQEEVDSLARAIGARAPGDPVIWFAYPKGSSKRYRCEFNRDRGWHRLGEEGLEPVRQVSIDEAWSALRFRRVEHIKSFTRERKHALSEEGKARSQGG